MSSLENKSPTDGWDYESFYPSLKTWQKKKIAQVKSESGIKCLLDMWFNSAYKNITTEYCSGIWDNVYCWPPTPNGTEVTRLCLDLFKDSLPLEASHLKGSAKRVCLSNGGWAQADENVYAECIDSLETYLKEIEEQNKLIPVMNHILFFGSILSLLCLGTSLTIFRHFRCLHCDRVTVQTHLMLSLVLRCLLMITISEPFVFERATSYRNVDILCESVLVLFLYSTFASVSWMFIQGLFLNVTLMSPGVNMNCRKHLKVYYVVGWAVPAAFIIIYVISMSLKNQKKCWDGYSEMNEMWILLGPIILELVVNGLFLLNILRILLRKIRNSSSRSDASQLKAAAKATAILFPVLGINNLILMYNPGGEFTKFFVSINTFFGSTQGAFVAIVYCFTNKEVWSAIRRSIERFKARRIENTRRNSVNQLNRQGGPVELLENCSQVENDQNSTFNDNHAV